MAPLGELEEGDGFETNASSDDQYDILVELDDIFSQPHSLDDPSIMEFSEFTPPKELIDPISVEFYPDLPHTSPISSLSSYLPIVHSCLDPPDSTFVESETLVYGNACLD